MNLLNEPWLPVRHRNGRRSWIAPNQLADPDIVAFDADRADFNGALAQFAVGLLQTSTPVDDPITWRRLWFLDPGSPVSPRHLVATDGMVHTYYEADIDWRGIWDAASDQAVGVPPFGLRPYWISSQEPGGQPLPLSTLAFRGSQARAQVAIDPETPESVLQILARI